MITLPVTISWWLYAGSLDATAAVWFNSGAFNSAADG